MVTGINHLTFSVRDLVESVAFYTETLGFCLVARWSGGAHLLAGEAWIVLIQEPAARKPASDYSHTAFSVTGEDFKGLAGRIKRSGVEIWQENQSEGASLYFTDPDGRRLEIHASDLPARIAADRKDPPEGMEFYA